jgi:type VI secretion system protein VasD
MLSHSAARLSMLTVALTVISACKSAPPPAPEPPARATVSISASADVNPDTSGRPSPIVVHVYQLRAPVNLAGLDPFQLLQNDKSTLGEALAVGQEFLLQPGATVSTDTLLDASAREIAVVAAYRDIRNSRWHATAPLALDAGGTLEGGDHVTIAVGATAVSVSIGP